MIFTAQNKKIIGALLFIFLCLTLLFAQSDNLATNPLDANRNTALLCLEQSKDAVAQMDWQTAYDKAELGISYDGEIADLWFIKALSAENLQSSQNIAKQDIIQMLATALNGMSWIQYNRDGARIMYADLLSDTTEYEGALNVLNAMPSISGSDADYIRAKVYYRTQNFASARRIVANAKSLYPDDARFPFLFFMYEQEQMHNEDVKNYANLLLKNITQWSLEYPEIVLYASSYSDSDDEKVRLVKEYGATGLRHQLYVLRSLEYGILSEQKAFELLVTYSASGIYYDYLHQFIARLTDEAVKAQVDEWLTAFAGTLLFDVNGDLIVDVSANYKRGRATKVVFDKNQNGKPVWTANCDFGVPYSMILKDGNDTLEYGTYPALKTVQSIVNGTTIFYELTASALEWTPLDIVAAPFDGLATEFFIPVPKKDALRMTPLALLSGASRIDCAVRERENASVRLTLLDGKIQSALYSANGQPYAFAVFRDGILHFRNVDVDNDGFYELTETYAYAPDAIDEYMAEDAQQKLSYDLFGELDMAYGLYLEKAVHDTDKDGRADFFEEFGKNGERIATWDSDGDGFWEIRTILSGNIETSVFIHPVSQAEITVVKQNGKPISVETPRGYQAIYQDDFYGDLYWIGEKVEFATSQKVMKYFNLSSAKGVSLLDFLPNKRILAVKLGDCYFGELFEN